MKAVRAKQQVAFDGVQTVWRKERVSTHEIDAPATLSIDGVIVPGAMEQVASEILRRDIMQVAHVADVSKPVHPLTKLMKTMDGVLPLKGYTTAGA